MKKIVEEQELERTQKELDALNKSQEENKDGEIDVIGALEKALDGFSAVDLFKSEDGDEDEKDGEKDKDKDEEEEGEEKEDEKDLEKGLEDEQLLEEMQKASEAFADLQKSVEESDELHSAEFASLKKGMLSIAGIVNGIGRAVVAMHKSLEEIQGLPAAASGAKLGLGEQMRKGQEDDDGITSTSDARMILKKAMEDGDTAITPQIIGYRLDANGPQSIPAALREKYNIKVREA